MSRKGTGRTSRAAARMAPALRFERSVRADLQQRRWLRLHALAMGSVVFGASWAVSAALLHAGMGTLALRWPIALLGAYLVFIGLLWLWCRWLLSRDEGDAAGDGLDAAFNLADVLPGGRSGGGPVFRPGGGGDFGGGGSTGSFDAASVVPGENSLAMLADLPTASSDAGSGIGDAVSGVLDAAGSADEAAVVVVPIAVVVGIALLVASALGVAVFGLFGVEVLLGVAVEIAFAAAGGAAVYRAEREGWLLHALGRTWKPMLLLLAIVLTLGLVIDHWLPQADSLPQALRLLVG